MTIFVIFSTLISGFSANAADRGEINKKEILEATQQGIEIQNRTIKGGDAAEAICELLYVPFRDFYHPEDHEWKTIKISNSTIIGEIHVSKLAERGSCHSISIEKHPISIEFKNLEFIADNGEDALSISGVHVDLKISDSKFTGNVTLSQINLGDTTSLRNNQFNGNVLFDNVEFDVDNKFAANNSLETQEKQEKIVNIGKNTFAKKFLLTNSSIPGSLNMSENVFGGAFSIDTVTLGNLLKLQENDFKNATLMTRINRGTETSMNAYWAAIRERLYSGGFPKTTGILDVGSSQFAKSAIFQEINVSKLSLAPATLSEVYALDLNQDRLMKGGETQFSSGLRFLLSRCDVCDFSSIDVAGTARFDGLLAKKMNLHGAVFRNELSIRDAGFREINSDDTIFRGGLIIDPTTLARVSSACAPALRKTANSDEEHQRIELMRVCKDLFFNLSSIYEKSGDVDSSEEAKYQFERFDDASLVSDLIWGYGHKPRRLCVTILIIFLIYTVCYMTQISPHDNTLADRARRFWLALIFSFHCASGIAFAGDNTRNWTFRSLAISESVVLKALTLMLLYSIAQTHPVLHMLAEKIPY